MAANTSDRNQKVQAYNEWANKKKAEIENINLDILNSIQQSQLQDKLNAFHRKIKELEALTNSPAGKSKSELFNNLDSHLKEMKVTAQDIQDKLATARVIIEIPTSDKIPVIIVKRPVTFNDNPLKAFINFLVAPFVKLFKLKSPFEKEEQVFNDKETKKNIESQMAAQHNKMAVNDLIKKLNTYDNRIEGLIKEATREPENKQVEEKVLTEVKSTAEVTATMLPPDQTDQHTEAESLATTVPSTVADQTPQPVTTAEEIKQEREVASDLRTIPVHSDPSALTLKVVTEARDGNLENEGNEIENKINKIQPLPTPPNAPEMEITATATETPRTPSMPGIPVAPIAPEAPNVLEASNVSEAPSAPTVPSPPQIPAAPSIFQVPDAPNAPQIPDAPNAPEAHSFPIAPEAPIALEPIIQDAANAESRSNLLSAIQNKKLKSTVKQEKPAPERDKLMRQIKSAKLKKTEIGKKSESEPTGLAKLVVNVKEKAIHKNENIIFPTNRNRADSSSDKEWENVNLIQKKADEELAAETAKAKIEQEKKDKEQKQQADAERAINAQEAISAMRERKLKEEQKTEEERRAAATQKAEEERKANNAERKDMEEKNAYVAREREALLSGLSKRRMLAGKKDKSSEPVNPPISAPLGAKFKIPKSPTGKK